MEEFLEITEKYNKKGFLVERYYMENGKKVDLPIPKFMQENPTVVFWDPKIDWVKMTHWRDPKELTKEVNKILKENKQ